MIQIQRPEDGPHTLQVSGNLQKQSDSEAYDACPGRYNQGKKFPNPKHYSKRPVKDELVKIHKSKCCYCETWVVEQRDLDVEHFRPRAAYRQNCAQKKDGRPGYYWLTNCWDNLLLSCTTCNRDWKRTFFPLKNPRERARNHHEDVREEVPLLVDPVGQNPRNHIRFTDETPLGMTSEGKVTIKRLGLCRPVLTGDRRNHLNTIRNRYDSLKILGANSHIPDIATLAQKERKFIEDAMLPEEKFSSMVIDYVERHPL